MNAGRGWCAGCKAGAGPALDGDAGNSGCVTLPGEHCTIWEYGMPDKKSPPAPAAVPEAPRKRGRPKIYSEPLSQAERARRYRAKRANDFSPPDEMRDTALIDALRWCITHQHEAVDLYLEELVRRYHSKGAEALK